MVSKSQYQHYVPQFILRKFSNYIAPDEASFPTRKAYDKAVYSAKKKAKVQIIEFSRGFSNGTLDQRRCNGTFGIVDMYTPEIETKLGKLEEKVSKVIRKIEEDFYNGRTETTLVRTDKDLLRKFIFIMLYRNAGFHERFDGGEEDYASNDRKSLLEYMHERGFTLPKEVWLSNIDAFIDVDMSGDRENWMRWLRKRAYPMDALWYIKNMTNSYLCFCTPNRADEELVLTQNAYGVHEGPGSISSWMDWHTFTPINPKLVIVLRNTALDRASTLQPFMPNHMAQEFGQKFMTFRNMITSQFRDPVEAQSWLQDMPVNRPVTKYASASHEGDPRVTKYLLGPTDLFTFKFFRLTSEFIQRINSVFLEEAVLTNTIVYKTSHALRKALEFYLTIEKKGLKTVFEDTSDKQSEVVTVHDGVMKPIRDVSVYHRRAYLDMLVCIASDLGSTRKLMLPLRSSGPLIALKPHMSSVFLRRYTNLGFDKTILGWLHDEEQGRRMSFLWGRITSLIKPMEKATKQSILWQRVQFFSDLHPRHVFLHLRSMRILTDRPSFLLTADRQTHMELLVSSDNDGPEDVVAEYVRLFNAPRVSQAMMRASMMHQWIELNTAGPRETWQEDYVMIAWAVVGSIADCDLHFVKDAAFYLRQQIDILLWKRAAIERGYPEDLLLDLWIRETLHDTFETLLVNRDLDSQDILRLKDFIFRDLYPSFSLRKGA